MAQDPVVLKRISYDECHSNEGNPPMSKQAYQQKVEAKLARTAHAANDAWEDATRSGAFATYFDQGELKRSESPAEMNQSGAASLRPPPPETSS